jgi:hypothetical protein
MKYLILFFVIGLLLLSCNKNHEPDIPINDIDTLRQYFEFSINDTTIKFIENDSISFNTYWSFESKDSDTNYVFHIGSRIQITNNLEKHSNFDYYYIGFYSKISSSQTNLPTLYNQNTKLLKPGVFDSLFFTGQPNYLKQNCFDSISNNLYVGMIFPSFMKYHNNYLTHFHGCDKFINIDFYNNNNSYFIIEDIQNYYHKNYGESLLLTGIFRANLYPDPVPLNSNYLKFDDGKFKILISEPENAHHYDYNYEY